MAEKMYLNMVEDGLNYYKRSFEAKTPKIKIKHAKKSLKKLTRAVISGKKLKLKDKIPFLYETITQLNILIATSYGQLGELEDLVKYLKDGLISNNNSPTNKKKYQRDAFMLVELAKIANQINQIETALEYANKALKITKKLDTEDHIDILLDLNPIFIQALEVNDVHSNFKSLVKLAKKTKRKEVKGEIYFRYARYLFEVKKKYSKCKSFLKKARKIFSSTNHLNTVKLIDDFLKIKFDKDGNPRESKKE
ncbi:MAG: hypothetical protein GF364_15850 [Candidatus Lokiarchaeota archaeon]|nr:hypothetical protein [Candidatus Lokiarchaeota archaeon]